MNDKTLGVLGLTAVVLVVLTVIVGSSERTATFAFQSGQHLITDLDPSRVDVIEIESDESVTLKRGADEFVIAGLHNYPASAREVNRLLADLLGIELASEVGDDPDVHEELRVAAAGEQTTHVRLQDPDGQQLLGVFIADAADGDQYVRLDGSDTVYRVDGFVSPRTKPLDYVDRSLLELQRANVAKVQVAPKEGQVYTIESPAAGEVELKGIPDGKKAKGSEPDTVLGATSYLSFTTFEPAAQVEGLEFAASHTVTTRDEREYRLEVAQKDEKWWVRGSARYTGPWPLTVAKDDDQEHLERNEELAKAKAAVDEFNDTHEGWVYELSQWNAKNLVKSFDELVEEDDGRPDKVTASHILIAYAGAERATDEITRTKDEAKARAEELLAEVQAEPSKFADLAREHSDGPSAEQGGDLGEFAFDAMAEPFSEAAFALEPGQIADAVVETPFGFHVIQRTK